jgi:hypothetical protein
MYVNKTELRGHALDFGLILDDEKKKENETELHLKRVEGTIKE